nr:SDR family NAD(P)-dependent oxidoreductase [Lysinibacillus sp. ZYM-1]
MGRAPAELLALKGAKIVGNFRSNEKSAFEVVNHIQKIGGEAIAIEADVTIKEQVNALVEQAINLLGRAIGTLVEQGTIR